MRVFWLVSNFHKTNRRTIPSRCILDCNVEWTRPMNVQRKKAHHRAITTSIFFNRINIYWRADFLTSRLRELANQRADVCKAPTQRPRAAPIPKFVCWRSTQAPHVNLIYLPLVLACREHGRLVFAIRGSVSGFENSKGSRAEDHPIARKWLVLQLASAVVCLLRSYPPRVRRDYRWKLPKGNKDREHRRAFMRRCGHCAANPCDAERKPGRIVGANRAPRLDGRSHNNTARRVG